MDFMLYAMAIGELRTYFSINDAMAGLLGTVTLVMSGVGGDPVRRGLGPSRSHARADGDDSALLVRLAWRGHLTDIATAAAVARAARHRHGRRMGLGGGADQRDMAAGPSQQGHQHHAVGMGHRLHRGGADGGAGPRRAGRGPGDVAVAVCRRRAAGALHALDPAPRARAGGVGDPRRGGRARGQPLRGDLRARPSRPDASSSSCSGRRSSSPTGASSSGFRRSSPGPWHRAARAWVSSARSDGSSPCRSARISAI